jgi:hypothetical protein
MRFRDVLIEPLDSEQYLVISCDSCGGIGNKPGDVLKLSAYFTGRYTARVAILELLSVGAELKVISNAVANEMHPTAEEIIHGILDELQTAGLHNISLTGSTEENMQTSCTGVGITAIGTAKQSDLMIHKPVAGDVALLVGLPKMGDEVVLGEDPEIIQYDDVQRIRKEASVRQLLPIGSKGILYEAELQGDFILYDNITVSMERSGGPATSALLIASEATVKLLCKDLASPCEIVGCYR